MATTNGYISKGPKKKKKIKLPETLKKKKQYMIFNQGRKKRPYGRIKLGTLKKRIYQKGLQIAN